VTPSPYAIFANTASNLSGTISSANLSGAYSGAVSFSNGGNNFSGSFNGNGSNVTNVNAVTLGGLGANQFWKTTGNSNTTAGVNFLGAADNQPLELRVNNQRVLRLEPSTNSPNLIGGFSGNYVTNGATGAFIGGGGAAVVFGQSGLNRITDDFGVVGGGADNRAGNTNADPTDAYYATVGGGVHNVAEGVATFIGGGAENRAANNNTTIAGGYQNKAGGYISTIGGGDANIIQPGADYATIAGGRANVIQSNATYSAVAGGSFNVIQAGSFQSTIGGGYFNTMQTNAALATIGGGTGNTIQSNAAYATIGGGSYNVSGDRATVGGGEYNTSSGFDATVGGGYGNISSGTRATVGGGVINSAVGYAATIAGGWGNTSSGDYATVGGGQNNTSVGGYSTIGGGYYNTNIAYGSVMGGGQMNFIGTSSLATIAGGWGNKILDVASGASIGGGTFNLIQDNAGNATIAGGYNNTAGGSAATVPGGYLNSALGSYSFAAGQQAYANHDGTFVWSDSQNASFSSTATNQFSIRANGGVRFVTGGAGMTLDGQPVLTSSALSNVALRTGGNAFTGLQTITGGSVGIGTASPGRLLQVGDSSVASSEGMIHLGSRSASGLSLRDWELGVPQTGDFVTGEGYSFVIRDTTASANARLIIKWGTGNVGIGTPAPGHLLQVGANVSPPYCDGLTWVNGSDRNAKENFKSVDAREVLAKVAALPLSRWNYKEDKSNEHLGPMAQDFHASFGLNGADDTHIATLDEEGVALAAIQGLNQKVDSENARLREELKRRDAENAELRQRLEAVEKIIHHR
jgi:hypothetical protein